MQAYLRTRGGARHLDYAFLGAPPPVVWWADLQHWLITEEPELVVRRGDDQLGVLCTALPSARRDAIGTRVRYTLHVDDPSPAVAGALARAALHEPSRVALGARLDALVDADEVDAVLAGTGDGLDIGGRVAELLDGLPHSPAPPGDRSGSWVGAAEDEEARSAFLSRVAAIAAGRAGIALVSHAVSTVDGARRAAAGIPGELALLVADGDVDPGVTSLGKARPAGPAGPSPRPAAHPAVRHLTSRATALLTTGVLVVLLALTMLTALLTGVLTP